MMLYDFYIQMTIRIQGFKKITQMHRIVSQ